MTSHPFEAPFIVYIWPATLQALDSTGLLGQVLSSEDSLFRDPMAEGDESER